MKKIEIAKILEWHNSGTLKTDEAVERIFYLFSVVFRETELCDGLHSTDWNGKCFKCGEQVFIREPK